MINKVLKFSAVLFVIFMIWFSFIKKYDHEIMFQVNVPAGTMYDIVSSKIAWKKLNKSLEAKDKEVFSSFVQNLDINGNPIELKWVFENRKDTNSIVRISYLNQKNSLKERYLSLFKSSENLDSLILIAQAFKTKANTFSSTFKIDIHGKDTIPAFTYLYVSESAKREKKAENMINSNARLFIKNQDTLVTKTGHPFNYIKSWNLSTDSIQFRYAFPVKKQENYPTDQLVKVDELTETPAIKATFYGNYSLSDQAWIALYHYAKRQNIEVELTPIEIFYNNPMLGGDDTKWKAEVFLPLKQ